MLPSDEAHAQAPWEAAIAAAVEQIEAQDKDVRVLDLGAGAGMGQLDQVLAILNAPPSLSQAACD